MPEVDVRVHLVLDHHFDEHQVLAFDVVAKEILMVESVFEDLRDPVNTNHQVEELVGGPLKTA